MPSILFHFASGDALFTGAVLVVAGCLLMPLVSKRWAKIVLRAALLAGLLVAGAAAVPLPWLIYVVWSLSAVTWLMFSYRQPVSSNRVVWIATSAVVVSSTVVISWEIVWRCRQYVKAQPATTMYVIGDSLSAANDSRDTSAWPTRLRADQGIDVINLAQVGATLQTAQRQASQVAIGNSVVLIEIGGNDLLSQRAVLTFRADLDTLLQELNQPGRQLVMLELPLPPLYNGYGRAQRELSARHGVVLIPRRELASVIFTHNTTVDSLHLSEVGHRRMADMIWSHVSGSVKPQAQ